MRAYKAGLGFSMLASLALVSAVAQANGERPWPEEWPIELPPVEGPPPALPPAPSPQPPATASAARVLEVIEGIGESLRETRYQHRLVVRERRGIYRFDCALMVEWVLQRAAPRTVRHLRHLDRPRARHFADAIERAPTDGTRRGWQRIEDIRDVRPGDVFAWRRPPGFPSRSTGHVGFVIQTPRPVPGLPNGWAVRVADASQFRHQNGTRAAEGGFGTGEIVFLTDDEGRGTHYGWFGTRSAGYVVTPILFGRVGA